MKRLFSALPSFCQAKTPPASSQLVNPYTHQPLYSMPYLTQDQLYTHITDTASSQRKWKQTPLSTRIELVTKMTKGVLNDKEKLKPVIAAEIGKSYRDIDKEFQRLERVAFGLIEDGKKALERVTVTTSQSGVTQFTDYESLGLCLMFPYFSDPIFDSMVHLIPCLIAGNGALIKPSDYNHFLGPYLAAQSRKFFQRSSLISSIFLPPSMLPLLATFRSIKKIHYCGSHSSAKHIHQTMTEKRFIDVNVFFSGKDAAWVDQSADLDMAARQIVQSAMCNNGQGYGSVKRVYVHPDIEEEFTNKLEFHIEKLKLGNPTDPQTNLGPLCAAQNAQLAQKMINDAVSEGARCVTGGLATSDGKSQGVFFQPTLLADCDNDMLIVQTRVNCPILCLISLPSEDIAAEINENEYGTGVRIFTKNPDNYKQVIKRLELGRVCFNSGQLMAPGLPVQGWKMSGKGKILSPLAYEQYSLPKSYNIHPL